MHAAAVGFGLGFLVALQLGPMSLLLIRSTLRDGLRVGLAIGAGIAVIDALYATLGAAGAAPLLTIGPLRVGLGVLGTAVLAGLGAAPAGAGGSRYGGAGVAGAAHADGSGARPGRAGELRRHGRRGARLPHIARCDR